jgi:hypothetical protein
VVTQNGSRSEKPSHQSASLAEHSQVASSANRVEVPLRLSQPEKRRPQLRELRLWAQELAMSVATRKSALLAMRSPHLWPPEVRSSGHEMSAPFAEAST